MFTKLAAILTCGLLANVFVTSEKESVETPVPFAFVRETTQAASRDSLRPAIIAPEAVMASKEIPTAVTEPIARPKAKPVPKPSPTKTQKASNGNGKVKPSGKSVSRGSGACLNIGVHSNAAALCSAVKANFGKTTIGGFRAGAGEHGEGRAIDIMVYSNNAKGDAIKAFVMSHAGQYDVEYVIWEQHYFEVGGFDKPMEDRGSITQNHYDHVHVTLH